MNTVTNAPTFALPVQSPSNGDPATGDATGNQVTKLLLTTDNMGQMTTLLGAPKIEKQDMMAMSMGNQVGTFLMGTPQG